MLLAFSGGAPLLLRALGAPGARFQDLLAGLLLPVFLSFQVRALSEGRARV